MTVTVRRLADDSAVREISASQVIGSDQYDRFLCGVYRRINRLEEYVDARMATKLHRELTG